MKKLLLFLMVLACCGMSSCKKCTTCTIVTSAYTTQPEEFCGSEKDVEQFEKDKAEQAAALPYIGSRADCKRKN